MILNHQGLNNSAIYLTLPELSSAYGTTAATLTFLYSFDTLARLLVTAALGSALLKVGSAHLWVSCSLALMGGALALYPYAAKIPVLFALHSLNGMGYCSTLASKHWIPPNKIDKSTI